MTVVQRPWSPAASLAACIALVLAACSSPPEISSAPAPAAQTTEQHSGNDSSITPDVSDETGERPQPSERIGMRIRLDRRVDDDATVGFESFVEDVLTDERGWVQAGFDFSFDGPDHDYTVVLAEGPEVDALCLPYDTFGEFSCQIGPVVALNADRWRMAVEGWPGTLDDYRTMLVNHEVGHLLGQHHPASRCDDDGSPSPVMAQQSSGVEPCTANPWPLPWEINCARLGLEPLAPPFERDIKLTCGSAGLVE